MSPRNFWDDYAALYDTIWDAPPTWAVREAVGRLIGTPESIVDLACGTGLLSAGWTDRGAHVIGIDTSPAMLERATATSRISVAVARPAERTLLPSGVADAVLVGNLLHLHKNPAAVLAEARRLVQPGGAIVVTWPVAGLTPLAMLRADLASGRALPSAIRAHILRLRTGLRSVRAAGPESDRARGVTDVSTLEEYLMAQNPTVDLGVVARCQRVVALNSPSGCRGPSRSEQ